MSYFIGVADKDIVCSLQTAKKFRICIWICLLEMDEQIALAMLLEFFRCFSLGKTKYILFFIYKYISKA